MSELNSYVYPPSTPKQQCETTADLYRERARVLAMCKGTRVSPNLCVSFAVAIIQDKPAFIGDKLDHAFLGEVRVTGVTKNGKVILFDKGHCGDRMNCSWTPWNIKVSIQPTEYTSTPGAIKYVPDLRKRPTPGQHEATCTSHRTKGRSEPQSGERIERPARTP